MIANSSCTIGYKCPHCMNDVVSSINAFSLTEPVRIPCECGRSELTVTRHRDGRIQLSVPCLACENPHPFTLSSANFFTRDLFVLSCSMTGIDLCFIGSNMKVFAAMEKNNKMLQELSQRPDGEEEEEDRYFDPAVMLEMATALRALIDDSLVSCRCGAEFPKNLEVTLGYDSLTVRCGCCGAQQIYDAKTDADATRMWDTDAIILPGTPKPAGDGEGGEDGEK